MGLVERLRDIYARHGVKGALRIAPQQTRILLRTLSPKRIKARLNEREFDRRHGVDTTNPVYLSELDVDRESARHAQCYKPSGIDFTLKVIRALDIDYARYAFIDLGSGKGRTLLLASHFPFRRIIGVEFSRELTEIARRNLESYRSADQRCRALEAVWADAGAYQLPDGPLVIYFYNSFDEVVLGRVLANIRRSLEAHPRDIMLVCVNPVHRAVIDDAQFLRLERALDDGTILFYRAA